MTAHVVGNVTEDLVFSLPRLPRDGETLIATSRQTDLGGKGLNQALLLARAGCDVRFVAPVGADEPGRRARELVTRELPGARLVTVDAATDQSIICVGENGENHIISSAFAADALDGDAAVGDMRRLGSDDAVLVQGNLSAATTGAVLRAGRAAGAWTVANPSPIRWDWSDLLPICDLVIVNAAEIAALSGDSRRDPGALRARGAGAVLLTLGGDGARFLDSDGQIVQPAVPAPMVDTAGAGDTFAAVFLAARVRGASPASALEAAAQAAALTVSRRGTHSAFPARAEIADCLHIAGCPT